MLKLKTGHDSNELWYSRPTAVSSSLATALFVFIVAFEAVTLELPSLTVGDTMPVINTVIGNDYKLNQINAEDDNGCTYRSSMAVSTWTGMAIHGYLQLRSGRQTPCCVVYQRAELISECVAPRLYTMFCIHALEHSLATGSHALRPKTAVSFNTALPMQLEYFLLIYSLQVAVIFAVLLGY